MKELWDRPLAESFELFWIDSSLGFILLYKSYQLLLSRSKRNHRRKVFREIKKYEWVYHIHNYRTLSLSLLAEPSLFFAHNRDEMKERERRRDKCKVYDLSFPSSLLLLFLLSISLSNAGNFRLSDENSNEST